MDKNEGKQAPNEGAMLGGAADKLNPTIGGQSSGEDQSYLSRGISAVQQSVFGQGNGSGSSGETASVDEEKQDFHSAVDQAHPEKISEVLRDKHMSITKEEQNKEDGKT